MRLKMDLLTFNRYHENQVVEFKDNVANQVKSSEDVIKAIKCECGLDEDLEKALNRLIEACENYLKE